MHYDFDINVPAVTPETSKITHVLAINYGVLRRVWIYFRGGCADLAHIQLWRWGRQIFPSNPGGSYAFDNYIVEFEEFYPIIEAPYELQAIVWNDDDTFDHIVSCSFLVLPPSTVGNPAFRPTEEAELQSLLTELQSPGG